MRLHRPLNGQEARLDSGNSVNDGDPIRDVSLAAPDGASAVIQPSRAIAKREMGSMRLTNVCQESLATTDLKISHSAGATKVVQQLRYDVEKARLVVQ